MKKCGISEDIKYFLTPRYQLLMPKCLQTLIYHFMMTKINIASGKLYVANFGKHLTSLGGFSCLLLLHSLLQGLILFFFKWIFFTRLSVTWGWVPLLMEYCLFSLMLSQGSRYHASVDSALTIRRCRVQLERVLTFNSYSLYLQIAITTKGASFGAGKVTSCSQQMSSVAAIGSNPVQCREIKTDGGFLTPH